jgi:hypothetical protein
MTSHGEIHTHIHSATAPPLVGKVMKNEDDDGWAVR